MLPSVGSRRYTVNLSLFLFVLLCFSPFQLCQAQTSFASPEEAAKSLQSCQGEQCKQLANALHLGFAFDPKDCPSPEFVHAIQGDFEPGHRDALLAIKCSYDFGLVLLVRDTDKHWIYGDSRYLGAIYDRLTLSFARVIRPAEEDILIHNDVVLRGTGIYQADFEILRVLSGKFKAVLDTPEKGFAYPVGEQDKWSEQESSFLITAATEKEPGSLTEKMTLSLAGKKVFVERSFDWRQDFGIFEPSFWSRPEKPDAAK